VLATSGARQDEHEQSAEHMILRAVVGCIGEILHDNMMVNRILGGASE
jgi:hypothetical protein